MSSPSACSERIISTERRSTRKRPSASLAAPPAARRPPWRAGWSTSHWAPTLAVRSAFPQITVGFGGMRPSHGFISVAGVNPLPPTFDTVGILASSAAVLAHTASVLLGQEPLPHEEPGTVHLLRKSL